MNVRLAEKSPRTLDSSVSDWGSRRRRLRISIVSDAIRGRNGVGTYYADLIEHLRPAVEQIQLICPSAECDRDTERWSVPMPGDRTQRMVWPRYRKFVAQLDRQSPQLIVLPSLGVYTLMGMRYAIERSLPVLVVNHTNFDRLLPLYWPGVISKPLGWCLNWLNRWLIRRATMVAALNPDSFLAAKQLGADAVRIMGTPVSADFLNDRLVPPSADVRRFLFVGRLAIEKGVAEILDAAKTHTQYEFAIAGDGPGRCEVEAFASRHRNVSYLGWLSRDEVRREMDRSDALLLPSSIEAFGTVALEALARRRFVLLRRSCGIAKWPSFANGLFYLDDEKSVAEGIASFCKMSGQDRLATGRIGWEAVEDFNRHTIRVWLRFLTDAASNSCNRIVETIDG
ncbi:glycosyltransferase [Rhodopirellula sp. MGV]|uniref:glycosyltransferase n=1 Tax=Rhodopirellula sp. MGV TaxID=2023130 RepID=UPI000B96EED7|nr:glycosyltransferase [Rhodopirellula sp. MGV]OYP32968.1 hypothetical protein CGZ80_18890 [Rhodopirellula sp. MGV]PNY35375.1 hypothetical protein C2E31_17820 [Rhodopirellula baltica]